VVFCSPSQFVSFVEKHGFHQRFKKIEISGAKLEDELVRTLVKHFDQIIDIYGASETNKTFATLVTVKPDGTVLRRGRKLDSDIEIIRDDGRPCADGESGTVRVRNSYMAQGYIGAPEATAKNFSDGWFYPGDIASWGKDGQLEIAGRNDEVISFGGVKIDARLIDLIITSVAGVKDGISFKSPKATRNEVLAFVVFEEGADKERCIQDIRDAYLKHTGLPCFLGKIHEIDEIPYTDAGRPMRQLCQSMVLDKAQAGASW
jgi:acyl-coenzyme A synthetase/AMP-(fatty) acid ligase